MLVCEFMNMAKSFGLDSACCILSHDMQYFEIRHGEDFLNLWKTETGEDLVIPEDKVSPFNWYYEVFEDQQKLSTEGAKPIDFFPIKSVEDLRDFLLKCYNLKDDDQVDQWGVHIN